MKMYFVCDNQGPEWFLSYGVLSNGFCFGQHLCSHPRFAPGDLYFHRPKRIAALKEIFGIEEDTVESETIVVNSKDDVPDWWASHESLQDRLKPQYDRYKELVDKKKEAL